MPVPKLDSPLELTIARRLTAELEAYRRLYGHLPD
jgi:hypothetical protein